MLLDEVKRLKAEKKHVQNKEKTRILDEDATDKIEEGIYKNVENALNENDIKE